VDELPSQKIKSSAAKTPGPYTHPKQGPLSGQATLPCPIAMNLGCFLFLKYFLKI
jgi:hypothetical protein